MNPILYIKNFIILFFYQLPVNPGDGDTDIDSVPIDDYLIIGLVAGILMIVFFAYLQKSKVSNKIG